MKRYFNISSWQKSAFAAPTAPPQTEPDVAPATPETDPDEWEVPFKPGEIPQIVPDPQNRATRSGPGPATAPPQTEPDVVPATPETDPDDDEWVVPFKPGELPKIIPDPQNNWFKRAAQADGNWHVDTDNGIQLTWNAITAGNDPHRNHATQTDFFRQHAYELAKESSHHGIASIREADSAPNVRSVMGVMQQLFGQLAAFEAAHKNQLERLAEAIAAKKLGLSKEMFKAELVTTGGGQISNNPHEHGRQQNEIQEEMGENNLDAMDVNDAIEAQIPMQFLAQGAGLNAMMEFQAIAEGLIDDARVPGDIVAKYHRLAKLLAGCHFTYDFYGNQKFAENMGSNDLVREEWEDEDGNKVKWKVHAKAITFPLLVYELVAGGIRINSLHGLNNNDAAAQNKNHFNAATGSKSVEALGFQSGGALDRKIKAFVNHIEKKYPTVNYQKILKALYIASPSDRSLFFSSLLRDEFEEAYRVLRSLKG